MINNKPIFEPWAIYETGYYAASNHCYGIRTEHDKNNCIAKIEGKDRKSKANAYLIASAPEMLDGLRSQLSWLKLALKHDSFIGAAKDGALNRIGSLERIIAKAEGRDA